MSSYRPQPPGHLHPMRSRFFADIAAVRVGLRPDQWGQTFFLNQPPQPPPPTHHSTTGKSEALPPSPSGGWLGNGVKMLILSSQFCQFPGENAKCQHLTPVDKMFLDLNEINIECSKDWGGGWLPPSSSAKCHNYIVVICKQCA